MGTRPKLQVTGRESQGRGPSGHDIKTETRMRRRRRRRGRNKSLVVHRLGLEVAVEAVRHEDITLSSRASAEAGPVRQRTTSGRRSSKFTPRKKSSYGSRDRFSSKDTSESAPVESQSNIQPSTTKKPKKQDSKNKPKIEFKKFNRFKRPDLRKTLFRSKLFDKRPGLKA